MFEKMMNPGKKWKEPIPSFDHDLCPDKATFEMFLGSFYGMLSFQALRPAAVYEGVPPGFDSWNRKT